MSSWFKRFVQARGGSPEGVTGSWEKRAAVLYDVMDEPGNSYPEKMARSLGTSGSQGSWTKRLLGNVPAGTIGSSGRLLLEYARAPFDDEPGPEVEPTLKMALGPIYTKVLEVAAILSRLTPSDGPKVKVSDVASLVKDLYRVIAKGAGVTGVNYTAGVFYAWDDADEVDQGAWHDPASQNTKIIIPTGISRVRLTTWINFLNNAADNWLIAQIVKGSVTTATPGQALHSVEHGIATSHINLESPVLEVSAGDDFQLRIVTEDTSLDVSSASFFAAEAIPDTFSGALVTKAADQTTANYTSETPVAFDAEIYDVGGWHSNVSSNTKLIVPSGVTRVRVSCCFGITAFTADLWATVTISKGGTNFSGQASGLSNTGRTSAYICLSTPVVEVTAGNEFEIYAQVQTDTSVTVEKDRTWLAIEDCSGVQGALVRKASDLTGQNFTSIQTVTWDTEVYDDLGIHSTVSQTERLTVPSGVSRIRLRAQIFLQNYTGNGTTMIIQKNESTTVAAGASSQSGTGSAMVQAHTGVIDVTPGDHFRVRLTGITDTSADVRASHSWFAMEVVQ